MNFKCVVVGVLCILARTYSCFGSMADYDARAVGTSYYGRPYYDHLMGGMGFVDKNAGFVETLGIGFKTGLASSIVDSMRKSFDATLGSFVSKTAAAGNTVKKIFMGRLHNNRGLDVRELFGWKWMLDASIATHVSNAAKGARVLRARVLDQQVAETDAKPEALYGISVVKKDMAYMIERLTAQRAYYQDVAAKVSNRSLSNKVLDSAAAIGMGYVIIDSLVQRANQKDVVVQAQYWYGVFQKFSDLQSGVVRMDAPAPVPTQVEQWQKIALDNMGTCAQQLTSIQKTGSDNMGVLIKSALSLFVLYRVITWMRSDGAVHVADALCDVNRVQIVHLIDSVCGNLQHLIVLCDSIKQESDIARYKDDFESVSKNCSEELVHIAYFIDQNETLDIQRKGKPGQTAAAFGQGYAGLGAGLPKF